TKLAVSFTNIRINTDYQLIEGVVSTTYDTTWSDVESVDEFIDGLGDLIDEIEETVNTLFENGEITSEEKEDALGQLNEATTNLQGAAEQQNQADEKKQQAEKAESPEKEKLQEEAEKLEKESKETQQEVNKALNELQNKFGVKGKDGGLEIKTDAFFDGVISYGKGKNVITHKRLDGNGEISINTTDSNNNIPDTSDYNFTHNGKQYNVIVTHSNSTIEAINEAKDKAVNPSTGIVIYFHYDLEKENLGYTVNFAPDYFDNLPNQDFLEVQELHKEALSNLLKQLQSSEDIINVIYNNVLEINTLFQESLNKIQLPETIWNPDAENYTNNDFHFEPLEAGLIDGAIEEIKSIPLLISLVVDYSTNPKTREKINKAFSDFDFTNAMDKWYESRKDLYTSGTIHKIEHRTGKDVVEVGTLIGTGGLATLGKIKKGADLVEGVTSAIKKVAKEGKSVFKSFSKPIAFGGDIIKNTGKKLNILGRANPKKGSIGTKKIYDELIAQGVSKTELTGLFQTMPREWNKMKIIDMNTKYWKEINRPHIDNVIANGGDIRFIHDPRLSINKYSIIDDLPETSLIEKAFKAKAKREGLKKIPTFLKWEYDYLLKRGYVIKDNGLMVKL
ncbi:coiled-coil domain-containing protein, partial [Tenacibaculum maritimum]|uniref:coiled-coil domain-containing protein n=1 Tax=Tenacibaculum maritimum TaxID=107401 RepID=UPI00191615EE